MLCFGGKTVSLESIVALENVSKVFHSPAGEFAALQNINLRIKAGEFVGVLGKSGSGKTTLMNIITGVDRASSGTVIVTGTNITRMTENALAKWRGRNVGIVFQFFQLLPTLTVLENVMLPMDFCKTYTASERIMRAKTLLDCVGLAGSYHKMPSALSGGQQQRVAIARALSNDPPLLIADEPTGNLDSTTAESVFQLFNELAHSGKTIIIVTHDLEQAERVNRAVLIADGCIAHDPQGGLNHA